MEKLKIYNKEEKLLNICYVLFVSIETETIVTKLFQSKLFHKTKCLSYEIV